MAFVKKVGRRYQVRQGNNNDLLSTFSGRARAAKEVKRLHKKNKPKASNRGGNAARRFRGKKS